MSISLKGLEQLLGDDKEDAMKIFTSEIVMSDDWDTDAGTGTCD